MVSRPPPTAAPSTTHSTLNTAYSLALLSEYTHTLDSLPLDLSRSFADLRELDAVLSSSMITITAKIHHLTSMVEEHRGTKEERLWLLHEIAEEAARLKYGGDDKIRVACQAADTLKAHSTHLRTLAERLPDFDAALLNRRTVYPHVSAKSFMPLNMDTGRRRRGGAGSSGLLVASAVDPSPAKRKRFAREEEIDIGSVRSPHKKERTLEPPNPRARTNGRVKKNERVPSPSESLVSVTSHLPSQNTHHTNGTAAAARGASSHQQNHTSTVPASSANNRSTNGTNTATKRRGGNNAAATTNANSSRVSTTPLPNDYPPSHNPTSSVQSHRAGSSIPSSSSNHHPAASSNLIMPFRNGPVVANGSGGAHPYDLPHSMSGTPDWNPPSAQQLEGPGMPIARSTSIHSTITNANGTTGSGGRNGNSTAVNSGGTDGGTTEAGDGDGDNDDGRTYCYCESVSYGEMIACDDENCEHEWFHLSCIGLTVCPEGSWFCNTCKNKRNAKRSGRGGKRRAAGNRAGGKA